MRGFVKRLMVCVLAGMLWLCPAYAQEESISLLLIGVDSANAEQPGRSDTMMLARISPKTGSVQLLSFLRDLYVPIPGHGANRLNAAYFYGGEELLKQTLETNFGVTIDRTVTVHYRVLAEWVDQLGGVDIEVTEPERRHLNKLLEDYGGTVPALEQPGRQQLNGLQALTYSRIRKIDSDFQRTSRQQTVIAAMIERMAQMGRWPLFKLAVSNLGKVDTDVSLGDLYRLAPMFGKLGEMDLQTAQVPFEGTYADTTVDGMMVLKPDLTKNQQAIAAFLANETAVSD